MREKVGWDKLIEVPQCMFLIVVGLRLSHPTKLNKIGKGNNKMNTKENLNGYLLATAGAVGGGFLGFVVFVWLIRQGLYGLALPGGLLGLGAGVFLKNRSIRFGIACAVLATLLGVFAEWWEFPFVVDASLGYFLTHLQDLKGITLVMIALGSFCAFWLGQGRENLRTDKQNDA
jgi:hypothetical protein